MLALNDYLRASGELQSDTTFTIYLNGSQVAERHISGADIFNTPSQFAVDPKLIQDMNEIRIVRAGNGPLYFSANARFFSTEEPITPAGNEIFVKRQYFKLVPRPTLLKGYVDDRELLLDGGTVQSGERIETLLTIEAKNDYDYLMFEDLKPAGFEAVEVRSGESLDAQELKSSAAARKFSAMNGMASSAMRTTGQTSAMPMIPAPAPQEDSDFTGRTCEVYQELRDRQVALFMDHLPQGVWEIRYDVRAETPGRFHALPVVGGAMYVPEIRCNTAETRVEVSDKEP